ncbi:Uncharacterised protein [Shigella flexneri]|nr:Uncharacterised protein [Shigella flexneri]
MWQSINRFHIVFPTIAEHRTNIDRTNGTDGLDAAILNCSIGCISCTGTNSHRTNSGIVDIRKRCQVINHGTDVFSTNVWVF